MGRLSRSEHSANLCFPFGLSSWGRDHCPPCFASQCVGTVDSLTLRPPYNHVLLLVFLSPASLSRLSTLVLPCAATLGPSQPELPSELLQQPHCFPDNSVVPSIVSYTVTRQICKACISLGPFPCAALHRVLLGDSPSCWENKAPMRLQDAALHHSTSSSHTRPPASCFSLAESGGLFSPVSLFPCSFSCYCFCSLC